MPSPLRLYECEYAVSGGLGGDLDLDLEGLLGFVDLALDRGRDRALDFGLSPSLSLSLSLSGAFDRPRPSNQLQNANA